MTQIQSVLGAAKAWAAAAAFALGGASTATAGTAIDLPGQVFPHDQTDAKPVVAWRSGSDVSTPDRDWAVGRNFHVTLPVGTGKRLPMTVHIISSEEKCHDNMDFTAAADVKNQEQDFIRGGEHY